MADTIELSYLSLERGQLQTKAKTGTLDDDERARLDALNQLDTNLWCGLGDGARANRFLIAEDDWTDYVRDYVEGMGEIPSVLDTHIDWGRRRGLPPH